MKRDMELIRQLLFELEEKPGAAGVSTLEVPGFTDLQVRKMDRIRQIMELERSGGFDKVHPDVKDELRRLYFELTGHHLMIAPDGEDPEQSARRYFDTLNAMNEDRGPLQ